MRKVLGIGGRLSRLRRQARKEGRWDAEILNEGIVNKVCIAIPAGDAYLHARLVQNIFPQIKANDFMIVSGVSPVAYARNLIVEGFLKTDAEYLWQVDADTIPPKDALEKMLALDKDIVAAVTPIVRKGQVTSNIYLDTSGTPLLMEEIRERTEPFSVEGSGASCILIKRSVFEKMTVPYYAEVWGNNGDFVSEDIFWGNVAKEEDFEITCIPSVICGHARSVVL